MRFGLKEEDIKKINNVFSDFPVVHEVLLYGSRAKGNYKHGSDIDLTMKGEQLDYNLLSDISLQLDDLLLPYTIDLSIFERLKNSDLMEHIHQVGKVFYKRNAVNVK